MRFSARITTLLLLIALLACGGLFLLDWAKIVNFEPLPILLFSSIFICSTLVLTMLHIDLPLNLLQRTLENSDPKSLVALSKTSGGFSRIAGQLLHIIGRAASAGENELVYRNIIESAPDAVVLVTAKGSIVVCNRAARALFGETPLAGRAITDFLDPPEQETLTRKLDLAIAGQPVDTFELTLVREDAPPLPVETAVSSIEKSDGRPVSCALFFRDITARKKAEKMKQATELQLLAICKLETAGQLARGVAHDLNNSLGAIAGYTDLIHRIVPAEDGETERGKIRRYVGMISSATTRCSSLIRQLLSSARRTHMQVVSFDLNDLVEEAMKLVEPNMSGITITADLRATSATIVGDPGQIQDAIVNMAINSKDAMPEGGTLTISTTNRLINEAFARSRIFKMTPGYYLLVSVTDTGIGMDEKTKSHLFEPFFTTKPVGKGTGLGLASVYGSIKNHHGYIEVESEPGQGSTFTLFLPVTQTPAEESTDAATAPAPSPKTRKTIMIIDDELQLREMVVELLSWLGYTALAFADARSAIEYYTRHNTEVDLAIIDWKMPGMDGMECFRELKNINPSIKALISTGYRIDANRQDFLAEGVIAILPKPFLSADLSRAVAEVLA